MSYDRIKLLVLDVDGTITDGNYYVNERGEVMKSFNTRDMHAINKAKEHFRILILTGADDNVIHAKMGHWGHKIISGVKDKHKALTKYLNSEGLDWENVAFLGDGENDFVCMQNSEFSGCPMDAIPEIVSTSTYVSNVYAGNGAVYDIIRYLYRLCNFDWTME